MPLTMTVRNIFVRGAPASLRNSEVTLFYRSEITVGIGVTQPGSINTMGKTGCQGQAAALNHQRDGIAIMTEPKQ